MNSITKIFSCVIIVTNVYLKNFNCEVLSFPYYISFCITMASNNHNKIGLLVFVSV